MRCRDDMGAPASSRFIAFTKASPTVDVNGRVATTVQPEGTGHGRGLGTDQRPLRRHGDRDQEAGGPSVPIQSGCAAVKAPTVSSRIAWNSCRVVLSRISKAWPPITSVWNRPPLVFTIVA